MAGVRWVLAVLIAVLAAARPAPTSADREPDVFPFVTGTTWTYAGTVRWTHHGNHISSGEVRRTSKAIDAFDHGDVAAALLHGGVWDLWWPDEPPRYYVLLRIGNRYYDVYDNAKQVFAALKTSGRRALWERRGYERWFEAPLRRGKIYYPVDLGPRRDTFYGYFVKSVSRGAYLLEYRTLGSDESISIVPGVGVAAFTYVHHGTVSEVHVRLVAYHRP